MSDDWLEIPDQDIDVTNIMHRIRIRVAQRQDIVNPTSGDPKSVVEDLWEEMIGEQTDTSALGKYVILLQNDCDIVPRHYVIDWRIPILGPIHAVVRRVINAEIRRYLLPSLKKQSHFNRKVLRALRSLAEENARLREELSQFRDKKD
jgi:hypothetical protein